LTIVGEEYVQEIPPPSPPVFPTMALFAIVGEET
jgi:hypothetical protein